MYTISTTCLPFWSRAVKSLATLVSLNNNQTLVVQQLVYDKTIIARPTKQLEAGKIYELCAKDGGQFFDLSNK